MEHIKLGDLDTSTCTTSTASTPARRSRTLSALAELVAQGKVCHIGLSAAGPATIRRAHALQLMLPGALSGVSAAGRR